MTICFILHNELSDIWLLILYPVGLFGVHCNINAKYETFFKSGDIICIDQLHFPSEIQNLPHFLIRTLKDHILE